MKFSIAMFCSYNGYTKQIVLLIHDMRAKLFYFSDANKQVTRISNPLHKLKVHTHYQSGRMWQFKLNTPSH